MMKKNGLLPCFIHLLSFALLFPLFPPLLSAFNIAYKHFFSTSSQLIEVGRQIDTIDILYTYVCSPMVNFRYALKYIVVFAFVYAVAETRVDLLYA